MNKIFIGLLSVLLVETAFADVELRVKDGNGDESVISGDGKHARINDRRMQGYVLIDYGADAIFMVNPQNREVMKSSLNAGDGASSAAQVDVSLKSEGGGPRVAGYKTRKYRLMADGENCGTVYTSSDLLKQREVRAMFDAMRSLQQNSRRMMGGMSGFMNTCQKANLQLSGAIEAHGAPMKIIDADGRLQSEVTKVETGKSFPADHYQLPPGMKLVNMDEKMKQAGQQTQQMMENMPDMNQIMEQMQQQGGGQMTEEMQQQMKNQMQKLQEALQQMQQQQQ